MIYPILLDNFGNAIAVYENAYNITREKEMITRSTGIETIQFTLPMKDKKRLKIKNEMRVEIDGRRYYVRYINDTKKSQSVCTYECDATWYELNEGELKAHISDSRYTARQALEEQLSGTGWVTGTVEISTMHAFSITEKHTVLYNLRYIQSIFGGDLEFDTKNKLVHLYSKLGKDIQRIVTYENNVPSIQRMSDTRDMVTRVYGIGKDGLKVDSINNGLPYVEDYSYFDNNGLDRKLIEYELKDERFTIPENLLEYMKEFLNTYCQPVLSYVVDFSVFNEYPEIGDRVYLVDKDFQVSKWVRILQVKEVLDVRSTSKYTLESIQNNYLTQTDNALSGLEDTIDEMRDALVYQRMLSCTIYQNTHEVEAMYELGNVIHYTYEENADGGITFRFPDGKECIIRFLNG